MELLKDIWKPVLEILILAVGIYYAASFVRGTRGAAILTGTLGLMLSLALLSTLLELQVLRWILSVFSSAFAVSVVVIFQPEIRQLLAQIGSLELFYTSHEQRENIEVIVQTVERLADVRIGALIALEQSIQLHDVAESGIPIDCIATPEMLETIFFPNNAVHDGGVIIKGDRIAYAACIFPLTGRQDLNKSIGTRHRAALGLSEETDAVVVVVSEETGMISYAHKGELVRGLSVEGLRAYLSGVVLQESRRRTLFDRVRGFTLDHLRPAAAEKTPSK